MSSDAVTKIKSRSNEEHQERVDRFKILYDLNKHITTLSMGTLLLMAGLFEKVFKAPHWKVFGALSFTCFTASVLGAVFSMFGYGMYARKTFRSDDDPVELGQKAFLFTLGSFISGVVNFTVFTLLNLLGT